MFVEFFIKRPMLATVLALAIVIAGVLSIGQLPIAEYPDIAPPQVGVSSFYLGADARSVESGVTNLLENEINGANGVKYISSTSGSDGTSNITVTYERGHNVSLAAVDVQSRISATTARLPDQVRATGVHVDKALTSFVMSIALSSEVYGTEFLSNYASRYVTGALERVPGVGKVTIFGERKYAMRIWLDPEKLAKLGMTPLDVLAEVQQQNVQTAGGQIGQSPTAPNQSYQLSVRTSGRLTSKAEFENIILKARNGGAFVRLKDVARVDLGAEDYSSVVRYNGKPAVALAVFQTPGSNALEVTQGIQDTLNRLSKRFPPGMKASVAFDTTLAVKESIHDVLQTLIAAIALVIAVIFIFLEDWRTTLIPALTIPVSLIGTFAFMHLLGFSINVLTLFGITLATGLVVDDAIVVIENISRYAEERNMNPKDAAAGAMEEVFRAIIGISLVLCSVFIPIGFFSGTTGELYKQFALTIAVSVAISAFNSLTLTPALGAMWLAPAKQRRSLFFRITNGIIEWFKSAYKFSLKIVLKLRAVALILFAASLFLTHWLMTVVPSSFLPNEDEGYLMVVIQSPQGVSLDYTTKVLEKVEAELQKIPEIQSEFGVTGYGFNGSSPSNGLAFAALKPWSERRNSESSLSSVIAKLRPKLSTITEAVVVPFTPPAIQGLGTFGGFTFELQDMESADISRLATVSRTLIAKAATTPGLAGVFSSFSDDKPQLTVTVDREKAKSMNINVSQIYSIVQILLGSQYVNDFELQNQSCKVYLQADTEFRSNPAQISEYYVRSDTGQMVQLKNVVTITRSKGPTAISHYNLYRSVEINGSAAPGVSSGQAIELMQNLAAQVLPSGMTYSWTGISLEEIEAGPQALIIFGLAILSVFMVLAAQYENLADPLVVLLPMPLAIMGALGAQYLRGLENDIFCRIGLVMLVGLASKNAVLIVEFANRLRAGGEPLATAIVDASVIRWRPIIMTSLAFIMGILPLTVAEGAGAQARHSLGTAVCGGMVVSTVLCLYLVPVIYLTVHEINDFILKLFRKPAKSP